jgi:CheY-like chemotaxis protein
MLIKLGFNENDFLSIAEFSDVNSLVAYLQAIPGPLPKLIVSDYNMPVLSGIELLKKLKSDDRLKKIHVVMLSTSNAQHHIDDSFRTGAVGYYVKPSTVDEFKIIAKEIIDKLNRLSY